MTNNLSMTNILTEDGANRAILTALLKDNHLTLKDVWEDNGTSPGPPSPPAVHSAVS